ncbi:hotdog fold thioesterase [Paracoccus sp. S-4012]|uniref:PaaI family thioesterase n=1 Tax=Paracoccus sp. S-4012 TaxID=2665648 RepID=UPI0012B04C75|nr:PaaI family thioesterase [Paracoccus sp. S-4012]MRX52272.1 hotdog fold thioesterase [Paracoccus sp. S-4012]
MALAMDAAALNAFLAAEFPQVVPSHRVEEATEAGVQVRLTADPGQLRPGGTVSGPAMFGLADVAVYAALLSRIGPVALAVTTNASIDFMRKPAAGRDLIAEARLLKLGRSLAVADVLIRSEGEEAPVARASMTYAIPPKTA